MIAKFYRLRRWRVQKVLKKGEEKIIGMFTLRYIPNKKDFHRWSVVLSRKFAKQAVTRNKKRRQIYESIRNIVKEFDEKEGAQHYDIALIPHKHILTCNYEKILQNINDILSYLST